MGPVPPELIVAARLTLVPLRPEHAAEMAPVLADPDLYTFTGGAPPQAAELRARFKRWAVGPGDPALSWDNWVIQLCAHGALAGFVQATVTDAAGTLAAELAWVVGKPWQGRGIGSEAARALAGWLAGTTCGASSPTFTRTTGRPPRWRPPSASLRPASGRTVSNDGG